MDNMIYHLECQVINQDELRYPKSWFEQEPDTTLVYNNKQRFRMSKHVINRIFVQDLFRTSFFSCEVSSCRWSKDWSLRHQSHPSKDRVLQFQGLMNNEVFMREDNWKDTSK